jgi:protein-S-isoprenylcysteine O-methyltransferase Ste14
MKFKAAYLRIFGVGPAGVAMTVLIWLGAYGLEKALNFPSMSINPTFRMILIIIFLSDALYLIVGSNYQLRKKGRGKSLVCKGPFRLIRHPMYSAVIYSFTGLLAMGLYSWVLLVSVVPLTLSWSWLVHFEEQALLELFQDEYRVYMERTGQFLPSLKALSEPGVENNQV